MAKLSEWHLRMTDGISTKIKKVQDSADIAYNKFGKLNDKVKGFASGIKNAAMEVPGLGQALTLLSNPVALIGAAALAIGQFTGNMIEDTKQLHQSQGLIATAFGETGNRLNELTADTQAVSKVFNLQQDEIIKTTKALEANFDELKGNGQGALNLIVNGMQATRGQLQLDELREYAVQMKSVGLTAENTFAIASQQITQGIYSDKGFDAIKEAGLRLREMTPAAQDALRGIGLSADGLKQGLNSGSLSTFDAIQMVSKAMEGASVQAQQTAIADLFGGAGEDAGLPFLLSLQGINLEMKNLAESQDPIIRAQNERLVLEQEIAMKQLEFAPQLQDFHLKFQLIMLKVKSIFVSAFSWVLENGGMIKDVISGIAIAVGLMAGAWLVANFQFLLATAAVWALNIAMMANPIGIVIGLIGALVAAFIIMYKRSETVRGLFTGLWEALKVTFTAIKDTFVNIFGGIWDVLSGIFSGDTSKIKDGFKKLGSGLISANPVGFYMQHGKKIGSAFAEGYDEGVEQIKTKKLAENTKTPNVFDSLTTGANVGNTPSLANRKATNVTKSSAGLSTVTGGGTQTRNVTVNIGKLVEQIVLHATTIKEGAADIREIVQQEMIKAVHGSELALSND